MAVMKKAMVQPTPTEATKIATKTAKLRSYDATFEQNDGKNTE
jgi:hypothetical protein